MKFDQYLFKNSWYELNWLFPWQYLKYFPNGLDLLCSLRLSADIWNFSEHFSFNSSRPWKLHLCGRNYQNVGKYWWFAQTEIGRFRRAGWQHCILQKAKQIRWLSAFVEVNWWMKWKQIFQKTLNPWAEISQVPLETFISELRPLWWAAGNKQPSRYPYPYPADQRRRGDVCSFPAAHQSGHI